MIDVSFKPGDWVEVQSKAHILSTLDSCGQLDGMPFMPEMFAYCGMRFQVQKRAHKTCDTVFPVRGRRVEKSVHLATRCSGEAHGGCQAGCLIFWKTAWLKRVDAEAADSKSGERSSEPGGDSVNQGDSCTEECIRRAVFASGDANPTDVAYVCQATRLPYFTTTLNWWDLRQYVEDFRSGNERFSEIIVGLLYMGYNSLVNAGIGLGRPLRWLYGEFQRLRGGVPYPRLTGRIAPGAKTPAARLDLQPGDWVRVKPYEEILATLDTRNKNRGLFFDAEMVPYCGKTYRVLKRVTQILDEKTGRMLEMKNPCIILDDVYCRSRYSECRLFCPRAIYSYWREIWLERVEGPSPVHELRKR